MPMPAAEIERLIKTALPDAVVELTPLADDGDHWAALRPEDPRHIGNAGCLGGVQAVPALGGQGVVA